MSEQGCGRMSANATLDVSPLQAPFMEIKLSIAEWAEDSYRDRAHSSSLFASALGMAERVRLALSSPPRRARDVRVATSVGEWEVSEVISAQSSSDCA